jgi:hypothetical protein
MKKANYKVIQNNYINYGAMQRGILLNREADRSQASKHQWIKRQTCRYGERHRGQHRSREVLQNSEDYHEQEYINCILYVHVGLLSIA